MKKLVIAIIGCLFMCKASFAQIPANDSHWSIVWEDHFNSFNSTKWAKAHYCDHYGCPTLYLAQNAWISDGNLVIQITNNTVVPPSSLPPIEAWGCGSSCTTGKAYNYTSGWVETIDNYNTQYGYIEARIKVPKIKGSNSAFWTHVGVHNASNAAEIDIFELYGSNPANVVNTNIHKCYDAWCKDDLVKLYLSNFDYRDWHTYAIEWDKNRIIWYIDSKVVRTLNNHGIVDPVRIIFSASIDPTEKPSPGSFPGYMLVDYVKVYGLKCDKNTAVNEIPNFNTYDYSVKKSITLSGATTIPTNKNITLRANDFIELKPGFYAPVGTSLYLDVSPCEEKKAEIGKKNLVQFYDSLVITGYLSNLVSRADFLVFDMNDSLVHSIIITERDTISIGINANDLHISGTYRCVLEAEDEESDTLQITLMEDVGEIDVLNNSPYIFDEVATIACYIPQTIQEATLHVYNVCGVLMKTFSISERGTVSIDISANELPSTGVYTYSLAGDSQIIESMELVLTSKM